MTISVASKRRVIGSTAVARRAGVHAAMRATTRRRIVHWNVTAHPTADWTIQHCHTAITGETLHRFLIHDRDAIYAPAVDRAIRSMGLRVPKTPVRTPQANAFCEPLIGTIRRECLDWLILLDQPHLRQILTTWVAHYNRGHCMPAWDRGFPSHHRR
jgi:transposase InsO family protein